MAMEYKHTIVDAHPKPILCVQFNPFRREIYTGGEDAMIRVWECESGKLLNCFSEHTGWISSLLYCKELKTLFSCSIDGLIIAWGWSPSGSGKVLQKIATGSPVFSLAYNARRQQLLVGCTKRVRIFRVIQNDDMHSTSDVLDPKSVSCTEHTDIVSCIVSCEGRFYSAGYDRKIVIYDIPHHGDLKINVSHSICNAHDAAISCMVYGKDADNSWLITGAFDKIVKLWSLDGNLLQKFDGFSDTINSVCYVIPTQTLWITASSSCPVVFDPRSGINVSDFVSTDNELFHQHNGAFFFRQLLFVPEINEVIGLSNRRSVTTWKYNPVASVTVLSGHTDVVECLALTTKEPLLIFSGGGDGVIRKWERLQLNSFMYSQETLALPKEEKPDEEVFHNHISKDPEERRKKQAALHKRVTKSLSSWKRVMQEDLEGHKSQVELMARSTVKEWRRKHIMMNERQSTSSDEAEKKSIAQKKKAEIAKDLTKPAKSGVLSLFYYEDLDYLISGYEDSRIHIWGYNIESMKFTAEMQAAADFGNGEGLESGITGESVTNRVAGMSLKHTLQNHKDGVSCLTCFNLEGRHWMVSSGWDRRICIWDLRTVRLHDVFRHGSSSGLASGKDEYAADGIILDIEYAPELNEIGYASADKMAYIRKFSPKGDEMKLQCVLQGHEAEVTRIRWNEKFEQWVTGSEDRTVRIWPKEGIPCLRVVNNDGPLTALSIDLFNGCIITGSQDRAIRVFDPSLKECSMVQKNVGHTDEIKAILHIPGRNQYVSAAWDNTLRIWNAYLKKGQRRVSTKSSGDYHAMGFFDEIDEAQSAEATAAAAASKPANSKDQVELPKKLDVATEKSFEQTQLEDELRQTLNDLETAIMNPSGPKKP
ncbi:WD40-repeat-containing domain protein [Polychytrium aggregatum]|uniref:WD40-repeat-containing domain protein n=1 Tax=Polychytrium aggregatum TaxID=110093 RepID=UPI0022FEC8BC|nr:WD40-repeat-containing domain protein [Polychytrium aggregatum]KAI9199249.1 WD40-repeat-containing domain protein [Polychytrium aggregatum]